MKYLGTISNNKDLVTKEYVDNAVSGISVGVTGVKGNSESNYRQGNVNLTAANIGAAKYEGLGSFNDYIRIVIALCKTTNQNVGSDSWFDGEIVRQRVNGLVPNYVAKVVFNDTYSTAYGAQYSLLSNYENTSKAKLGATSGFRACTFTYNNNRYAGLEFYQTQAAYFECTKFGGNFSPFAVGYYNVNTGTVLNSEIADSIQYTDNLIRLNYDSQTVNNHTVEKDVPSDAKFTDTVTTVTVTGNGNALTAVTASDGALTFTRGATYLTLDTLPIYDGTVT